jgi:hypothetical protein
MRIPDIVEAPSVISACYQLVARIHVVQLTWPLA